MNFLDQIKAKDKVSISGCSHFFEVVIGKVPCINFLIKIDSKCNDNYSIQSAIRNASLMTKDGVPNFPEQDRSYFESIPDDGSKFLWVRSNEVTGFKGYRSVPL